MHRRQNPHSRAEGNNNTSPPSTPAPTNTTTNTSVSSTSHRQSSSSSTTTTTAANAKKPSVRPQRPTLPHRKSASAHLPHTLTHSHNLAYNHHRRKSSHQTISKLLGPGSGPANWSAQPDDDKPEMATSFLQYCAMCEKQITVPSNSVLYCSESCRRKDSCKPLSASSYTYTMTSTTTPPSSPPMSPRDIVAPLTPTRSSSPTTSSVLPRIPSDLHDAKSDLDPTEWKPVIPHHHLPQDRRLRTPSSTSLSSSSEAWTFLSQFHHHPHNDFGPGLRRSTTHRSSAVSLSSTLAGLAPSLINTPSTMASSLSSSTGSPLDYNFGHDTAAGASAGAGATRPLPPRHNPSYTGATKGVELVVPHIAAPVLLTTAATNSAVASGESLASSPTDSHDGGVWLKLHHRHRQSAPAAAVASGASFATH
ncbi:hypothetical protein PISL3812_07625 [Talaromyces islandicus]|uniref:Life-span regulatory factor domain-containing protein n=1 Tax=Talaromyces islandicus TaxID=28573 RepID=A0A0U1M6A4_TALIS|nr:hypothetical protein PISL3812_07625 [Talaromyces islandicus]